MDKCEKTFSLLPYILNLLSRKFNYSSTVDAIYTEIRDEIPEGQLKGIDSIETAVQFALNVGSDLGIIALEDDLGPKKSKKKLQNFKEDHKVREARETREAREAGEARNIRAGKGTKDTRVRLGVAEIKKPAPTKSKVPNEAKFSVKLARQSQKKRTAGRPLPDCATCLGRHRPIARK